jgi:hypothetical protein
MQDLKQKPWHDASVMQPSSQHFRGASLLLPQQEHAHQQQPQVKQEEEQTHQGAEVNSAGFAVAARVRNIRTGKHTSGYQRNRLAINRMEREVRFGF